MDKALGSTNSPMDIIEKKWNRKEQEWCGKVLKQISFPSLWL